MEENGVEEAFPSAAAILRAASWKPHDRWGVYTSGTLVMGFSPDGNHFDVKDWGLPVHGPDYPDDPVEAAQWLVNLRKPANPLASDATLEPPAMSDAERRAIEEFENYANEGTHVPESQEGDDTGEASSHPVGGGDEAVAEGDDGGAEDGPASGGREVLAHDGQAWPSDSGLEPDEDYEAEFEEVAVEGLTEGADLLELEAPSLGEEILDEGQVEAELPPQDRFIGLDDLDRVRRLRIGDVAAAAAVRIAAIEAATNERVGEFAAIQGYVTTHLDKHTGAFTGNDTVAWDRFIVLSDARAAISAIDDHRKRATAFLLAETTTRDDVVHFDPEACWP